MKINTSYLGLMLASNHTKLQYVLGKKVILALRCHVAFVFSSVTHNPMSFAGVDSLSVPCIPHRHEHRSGILKLCPHTHDTRCLKLRWMDLRAVS